MSLKYRNEQYTLSNFEQPSSAHIYLYYVSKQIIYIKCITFGLFLLVHSPIYIYSISFFHIAFSSATIIIISTHHTIRNHIDENHIRQQRIYNFVSVSGIALNIIVINYFGNRIARWALQLCRDDLTSILYIYRNFCKHQRVVTFANSEA